MQPRTGRTLLFLVLAALAAIALLSGPPLAEHEAIVAQIARQTLQAGHWLVPYCIETPFIIKPPLVPWLAAVAAMILPHDAASGLPVTALAARLPSMLATALTVLLLNFAGRSMFGRRAGWLTAFIYATSIGAWLFAVNATAEAALTLFCTWAFIEFWWSQQTNVPSRRRWHLLRFYVAFGLAMLAKGPMPLSMVAIPIAAYWWIERPTRLLAVSGPRRFTLALNYCLRRAPARLVQALRCLGLWWGVPIFLLLFLPWMLWVARCDPLAWRIWNFEYLHRLKGDYPGEGQGGRFYYLYYLPLLFGLAIPWAISLPEALAAPFLTAYRRHRKALTYAWFWAVISVLLMSKMKFQKPYYILPAMPACALLLTPVLARLFDATRPISAKKVRAATIATCSVLVLVAVTGGVVMRWRYPEAWAQPLSRWAIPSCVALCVAGFSIAGALYLRGRCTDSLAAIGLTFATTFTLGWTVFGSALENSREPIAVVEGLRRCGIPADEPLWVPNRPDTRIVFYGHVPVKPIVDPYRFVAEEGGRWDDPEHKEKVAGMMYDMLKRDQPVCILLDRGQFNNFQRWFNPPARELFSVHRGKSGESRSDIVIITNRGVAARAATAPATDARRLEREGIPLKRRQPRSNMPNLKIRSRPLIVSALGLVAAVGCDPILSLLAPIGIVGVPRTTGPYLQIERPDAVTVSWFTPQFAVGSVEITDSADATAARTLTESESRRHHSIQIDALTAGHAYQYRLAGPAATDTAWHALPTPKAAGQPVVLAVIGDSGAASPDQFAVADQIAAGDANYVLHTGDVVYPAGADFTYDATVFLPDSAFLTTKPLLPCIGNHDVATLDAAAYLENFLLPRNGPPGLTERCYSIDLGDVHLASIDRTRDDHTINNVVLPWLRADLAAATAKWKIVMFHYPLYTSGTPARPPNPADLTLWGGLFDDAHVDFCLAGHDHFYERSQPLRAGNVVAAGQGTVYLVDGDGGAGLYGLTSPRAAYSAASNDQVHGYTRLAFNGSHVDLTHFDLTGQILDQTNWDK